MANNYLEFAEVLPNLTAEEEAWLKHQLERVIVAPDGQEYPKDAPEAAEVDEPVFEGPRAFRDFPHFMDICYDGVPEFQYSFDDPANASEDPWGRHLFLYAEEAGQPDQPAHLVQKFLRRFRPNDHWTLGYACWSDACVVGEFGGGALFVTADRTQSMNTFDFVEEAETEFKARKQREVAVERRFVLYDFDSGDLASTCVYDDAREAAEDADLLDNVIVVGFTLEPRPAWSVAGKEGA